jgi:RNA polymerase sigma factor (sigma-70 family)
MAGLRAGVVFSGEVLQEISMSEKPSSSRDFASLYRNTVAPLRRHLARILGNPSEAQDVAHDAYLKVYPVMENQEAQKPEALLYTTARRLAFNRLKRRRIAPFAPEPPMADRSPSSNPGVVQQVMARQELQQLEQAIAHLPEGCRAVLLLRKIELLSHQEIADRLGIAVSTVEKQHARALRLLRAALSAHQPAAPAPRSGEAQP